MSSKVYIETFGCQMNVADTERAATGLRKAGYDMQFIGGGRASDEPHMERAAAAGASPGEPADNMADDDIPF